MKTFEIIDFSQRIINSLLFRLLLVFYSFFIIIYYPNILPNYLYFVIAFLYLTLYFLARQKHLLRLINDFLFLSIILLGKNITDPFLLVFLLFPIVNSINYSGIKRSPLLYVFTISSYIGLSYYYNKISVEKQIVSFFPLLTIIFLWFIEFYTSFRFKIRYFREKLNEEVDSFYTIKEGIKKPHKIYSGFISLINSRIRKDLIADLYCFTIVSDPEERIVIINGSKFIWRYSFNQPGFINKIREKKYLLNIDINIDKQDCSYNLALLVVVEKVEYLFVFLTNKRIPLYYLLIGFFSTLVPALTKMAKILLSEKRLQEIRQEELERLSLRSQYVTKATKTMHFIRNRLGPLNNLLRMLDEQKRVEPQMRDKFDLLLNSEKERARNELIEVIQRADYLLEKSNNPYNFTVTVPTSLERMYSILSRNLNIFFPGIEIRIAKGDTSEKRYVKINPEGFEIFLTDWLNNIKKYYNGIIEVYFLVDPDSVIIEFTNNVFVDDSKVDELISSLNSSDRTEIMKRTTHGLYLIKSSLEEMGIPYHAEKLSRDDDTYVRFNLKLDIIDHEDSNI